MDSWSPSMNRTPTVHGWLVVPNGFHKMEYGDHAWQQLHTETTTATARQGSNCSLSYWFRTVLSAVLSCWFRTVTHHQRNPSSPCVRANTSSSPPRGVLDSMNWHQTS
eukprot:2944586-Rhodomonas_salina.1